MEITLKALLNISNIEELVIEKDNEILFDGMAGDVSTEYLGKKWLI